jgi:hypothetical protein
MYSILEGERLKKYLFLFFVLLCLLGICRINLSADIHFQADFISRYIWRGFDLNPYTEPVFQPSLAYEWGKSGLSLDLWMSFSFANKEWNETQLTLAYSRQLSEHFSLKAGLIHYGWYFAPNFRFKDDTSHELFARLGMPETLFQPAITIFYDFTNGDGYYILLEAGYSFKPLEFFGAAVSASLGYNGGQWLAEDSDPGFSDLNLGLSLTYAVSEFRIIPFAYYTFVLLDAIGKEDHFWFGISLAYGLENREEK